MAAGAGYKGISKDIKWYYVGVASRPALSADLAAVDALAVDANLFAHTTGDPVAPAVAGGGQVAGNIEWREHGADQVVSAVDILPAPSADDNSIELSWVADLTNATHKALLEATESKFARLIADVQTNAGDGTRGTSAGNAQGTLMELIVQHADSPLTLPSGGTSVQATTTFTVVDDSASAKGRKFFHYGPP